MNINHKLWFTISWITISISLIVIVAIPKVWGIDFTGGSLLEISGGADQVSKVQEVLSQELSLNVTVQTTQSGSLLVRTSPLDQEQLEKAKTALRKADLLSGDVLRFESIGPTIGAELTRKAWLAIGAALGLMIIYLAYTFRGAKGLIAPWKFGVAAIYALVHDLLFVTAVFVVLGKWKGIEIDTLFVTAQLAIFGYSANDTIIIFDRLKTEWLSTRSHNLTATINKAVGDTIMRSLNTSLTILVVLLAMLFFGGSTIQWFILAMTIGTIVGSYSSIFVAAPCLSVLAKR